MLAAGGAARTISGDLWQGVWYQWRGRVVRRTHRRIPATVRPPPDLQHRDAASAGLRTAGGAQQGDALRARLQDNIRRFRQGAAQLSLALKASDTAIQPLWVGDNQRTLDLAHHLREHGLWVNAIRPPTVQPGGARMRITLTAAHQPQDIDRLLEVLHGVNV